MELQIITDKIQIEKLHNKFGSLMNKNRIGKPKVLRYTTPGGAGEAPASYFKVEEINFWWSNLHLSKNYKHYNLFGIDPDFERVNHILIQINVQKEFENLQEAAIWAKDILGNAYLLHSGKMGGGVEGITIENVGKYYGGARTVLIHNNREKEYFIVCQINSPGAFLQVVSFIKEIKKIKDILKQTNEPGNSMGREKSGKQMLLKKYTPEFWGKRKSYFQKGKIESVSDHGQIVDTLKSIIESEKSIKGECVKNKFVDLGIENKGIPLAIFEFKSSIGSQSIYTAVGQLMLHSHSLKTSPKKYVVLPNELDTEIEKDLKALDITTIRYTLQKGKVKFLNIHLITNAR